MLTARFREFMLVALPKVSGGLLTVAFNLLLLRYLEPAEFGAWSLCIAVIALADGIIGSAVDQSILQVAPAHRQRAPALATAVERAGLRLKFVMIGSVALLACLAAEPLALIFFGHAGHAVLVWLTAASVVSVLMLRSTFVHFQLDQHFAAYGRLDWLHQSLKFGGLAAILLWLTPSASLLLVPILAPPLLIFLGSLGSSRLTTTDPLPTRLQARQELTPALRTYLLTFGVSALSSRLDILLLAALASLDQVGVFAAGFALATIPELLGTYVAVVFGPHVTPRARDGSFPGLYRKVQLLLLGLAALGCLVAWLAWRNGAWALLPPAFSGAAEVVLALSLGTVAAMGAFPLAIPFAMLVRPRYILTLDLVALPALVIAYFFAIDGFGAIGAAWVTGIARFGKLMLLQMMVWKWAAAGAGRVAAVRGSAT